MIVLAAAVIAFPASWKSRAVALVVGSIGLQLLNLVRTTSLFLFLTLKVVESAGTGTTVPST